MSGHTPEANPERDTRTALSLLLTSTEARLSELLTALNPWGSDFETDAWRRVNELAASMWPHLMAVLHRHTEVSALQQAWAASFASRVHIGLLHRAGIANDATAAEARRLRDVTLARWHGSLYPNGDSRYRSLVQFLMASDASMAGIPDLGPHTKFRGSIRLRYRVAHECRAGAALTQVLHAASTQPAATLYQRRVELTRAVRSAVNAGRKWRHFNETEFSLLPQPSQTLLLQVPEVWPSVLAQPLVADKAFATHALAWMAERDALLQLLGQLMVEVRQRHLATVEALVAKVPDTPLARGLCARLRHEPWGLDEDATHIAVRENFGPWVPMSRAALDRLQAWAPVPLPRYWAMSALELTERICAREFDPAPDSRAIKIVAQDLAPLRRTWSTGEQEALLEQGYPHLVGTASPAWLSVPLAAVADALKGVRFGRTSVVAKRLEQLPDARPWLALMMAAPDADQARALRDLAQAAIDVHWRHRQDYGWGRWIASAYGCEGWDAIEAVALARTEPLRDVIAMFKMGRMPVAPGAFQRVVARSMHRTDSLPPRPLKYLKEWLVRDPLSARALADHAPQVWVEKLARNRATPLQTLDVFMASHHLPLQIRRLAMLNRLSRTTDAREIAAIAAQTAPGYGSIKSLKRLMVSGPTHVQGMAFVTVARRDGPRLVELQEQVGDAAFGSACRDAARYLTRTAAGPLQGADGRRAEHDAAVLELVACLGADAASSLMQVLRLCDHRAPAGCKLDATYTQHCIPKRNGGERVIHAPHPSVKALQRIILDKLLAPLGLHPAACGFVKGLSIVDNAQPHVGQAVVVNADIRNCFPSVRWPLVLGACRRALQGAAGHDLSDAAIRLLVDLTTAQGVLPVGAPTSPALLNLVLMRTDEVLHTQASRVGVRYTRYADDLTFSGGREAVGLLRLAQRTLAQIGLELDPAKTNIFRRGRRQMVTGLVVNDQVAVPRAIRRKLRAAVHRVECGQMSHWNGEPQSADALHGRLAFVGMAQESHAASLKQRLRAAERP